MPQLTQGLIVIVAVLIGLLLAIIVGYYLRQSQVNELSEALQQSQQRQEDLAEEHEQRLREATLQLQKDYEAQLADRMERYQAQLNEQRSQLEAEYQTRQSLTGGAPDQADSSVEQRIRKQYEARLKEAAAKIQQAYEQHLQEKLAEARSQAQQDNAQRLAERLSEYQDDMAQRLAQMEQDYEARLQLAQTGLTASGAVTAATDPSAEELELNLRRELETSLRNEYEQKLAEKIEHYQNELTQRTQELEQSYAAQLQLLQTSATPSPALADNSGEFDLDRAIAAANAVTLATGLDAGLDLGDFSANPAALPAEEADQAFDHLPWAAELADMDSNESDLESPFDTQHSDTFNLNSDFNSDDDLFGEPTAPPTDGVDTDLNTFSEEDLEGGAENEFGLSSEFETDDTLLDLDVLINDPDQDDAFDDRRDNLDSMSN